jgi:uncharacterized membrane protein YhaH (DUF805 family)
MKGPAIDGARVDYRKHDTRDVLDQRGPAEAYQPLGEQTMAELTVRCECGREIPVRATMAGTRVVCACGRVMLLPNMTDLQEGSEGPEFLSADSGGGAPRGRAAAGAAGAAPAGAGDMPFAAGWTSDPNPYASPQTVPEPVPSRERAPDETLDWLLFSFRGRIPRRAYWGATLGAGAVLMMAAFGVGAIAGVGAVTLTPLGLILFLALYGLAIWISLAVQIKRWHDRDKSAWWCLINLIPYVGGIWTLVECGCLRGTLGPNAYGPDPT